MTTPNLKSHCSCDGEDHVKHLISVGEAKEIALSLVPSGRPTKLVDLKEALHRVVARDLHAPSAMPFFDNSAMDGYAVRSADMTGNGPWALVVGKVAAAGDKPTGLSAPAGAELSAVRIFTGAPVPGGYDAVIAQELCGRSGDTIHIAAKPKPGQNIRYAGSDTDRGAKLVSAGTRLGSRHIGLLAANGYGAINVCQTPKVALFSTGDELVEPGARANPGQIYDCNGPLLEALFAEHGVVASNLGRLPDDPAYIRAVLKDCAETHDLIVSTGSVSVGDRDYLKEAFRLAGGRIANWKVSVKPGKPVMFGTLGQTVFTGLPGNPFAAFVGFHLFVKPQLERLAGERRWPRQDNAATSGFHWQRKAGRAEVFPVKLIGHDDHGAPVLEKLGNSVSATLYPLAGADGLAFVAADTDAVMPGDTLKWQCFSPMGQL